MNQNVILWLYCYGSGVYSVSEHSLHCYVNLMLYPPWTLKLDLRHVLNYKYLCIIFCSITKKLPMCLSHKFFFSVLSPCGSSRESKHLTTPNIGAIPTWYLTADRHNWSIPAWTGRGIVWIFYCQEIWRQIFWNLYTGKLSEDCMFIRRSKYAQNLAML